MSMQEQVRLWLYEYDELPYIRDNTFIKYLKQKGFEEVDRKITSWAADDYTYSVVVFSNGKEYFSVKNNENSYGNKGYYWYDSVTEVFPRQKVVTVYEAEKPTDYKFIGE